MTRAPAERTVTRVAALALAAIAVAALALMPAPAAAQSGEELLQTAMERYESRAEGIDSYTVVQETMGSTSTLRFVKQTVDGHPVFLPEGSVGAAEMNPWARFPELAQRAEVEGSETVNGVETTVLGISDLEGLGFGEAMAESEAVSGFTPKEMTLYIDTDDYLLRRMKLTGTGQTGSGTSDMTLVADLLDYREVEGFSHPFRMEMSITGLSTGMSQEEMEEARQQMEEYQARLEAMPEQQRAMMEKMVGPQMEKLRKMLQSGSMDFAVTVKSLEVNTPPSEEAGS